MQTKPEFRRSERLGREFIIKLEDELTLSPYYAVSYNLSETGMYFKSLFELYPGAYILIRIDDYTLSKNKVPARVVWCKKLENSTTFRFSVGVEFLQLEESFGVTASLSAAPRTKTSDKKQGGVVIRMEKRSPE